MTIARSRQRRARRHAVVERVRRTPPAAGRRRRASATSARAPTASTPTRNLNYAESGGNANRKLFAQAGTATINCPRRLGEVALPLAAGGGEPAVQERAAAEGRLHVEQGDERGRRRRRRVHVGAAVAVAPQLRAGRLRPSAHAADGVRVPAAVRARTARTRWHWSSRTGRSTGSRRGCRARRSRSAATTACCSSRAAARRSTSPEMPKPGFGEAGPDEQWYDPALFSQPGNAWGNTGRNQFRGPGNWNLDFSLFRAIPFGHYRVGDPRGVAERVQPRAVGQPGDRVHRPELHAHPHAWPVRRARYSSACVSSSSELSRPDRPGGPEGRRGRKGAGSPFLPFFVFPVRGSRVDKRVVIGCVVGVLALGQAAGAQPPGSPLLKELSAIAERQLKERADAVAAVRDQAGAQARTDGGASRGFCR